MQKLQAQGGLATARWPDDGGNRVRKYSAAEHLVEPGNTERQPHFRDKARGRRRTRSLRTGIHPDTTAGNFEKMTSLLMITAPELSNFELPNGAQPDIFMMESDDSIERILKPLQPRLFRARTAEQFREALSAILEEVSRM